MEPGEKTLIDTAIKQHCDNTAEIIRSAFLHHFGFPITDVRDGENLEHLIPVNTKGVESYRYRGETFLYIAQTKEIQVDPYKEKPEWPQFTVTTKYIEV